MVVTELPQYTQNKTAVETSVRTQGNTDMEKVKMTVSADGAAHIMSLLTDLYSDPNLAVLREYTSNAVDSHKEAGQTKPIEVTLPSSLSSNFIVQDFGVGMSADGIRDIYSSYGKSTKQKDFNQIGAFGLGCKSALTITQQFTIVAVKNGEKTVATIARGEDGVGEVNVISVAQTDDPNGVKVTIPIPNPTKFNDRVTNFFYTWEQGTVLVDGKAPKSLDTDGFSRSDDDLFWYNVEFRGYNNNGFNVIIGGISYPISYTDVWGSDYSYNADAAPKVVRATSNAGSFYINIPIGSVDLTPSREGLRYSPRTVKFLKELTSTVSDEVIRMARAKVTKAETRHEALKMNLKFHKYRYNVGIREVLKWNDEPIPDSFKVSGMSIQTAPSHARAKLSKFMINEFRISEHVLKDKPILIAKVDDTTEIGKVQRNAYEYMCASYDDPGDVTIIATTDTIDSPWVLETNIVKFVDLDDIVDTAKEYRKENRSNSPKVPSTPISYHVIGKKDIKSDGVYSFDYSLRVPADISAKAFYIEQADTSYGFSAISKIISANKIDAHTTNSLHKMWDLLGLSNDDEIVLLTKNKTVKALEKRVKNELRDFAVYTKDSLETYKKTISTTDKFMYSLQGQSSKYSKILRDLQTLERKLPSIPDPDIKVILDMYKSSVKVQNTLGTYGEFISIYDIVSNTSENREEYTKMYQQLDVIQKRYPLLPLGDYYNHGFDNNLEHVMLYMKAVTQDLKERKS